MMLIDASWPSNRLAAVTKRTLCEGLVDERRAAASFMANLARLGYLDRRPAAQRVEGQLYREALRWRAAVPRWRTSITLHDVYVNVNTGMAEIVVR